jgi:hypothetical protein
LNVSESTSNSLESEAKYNIIAPKAMFFLHPQFWPVVIQQKYILRLNILKQCLIMSFLHHLDLISYHVFNYQSILINDDWLNKPMTKSMEKGKYAFYLIGGKT